jgi:serine/threonine protein kinase
MNVPVQPDLLVKKVEEEVRIMSVVADHPNIIKLIYSFRINFQVFILMEFFEGRDLLGFVPEDGIDEEEAKVIFLQLLSALAHCHEKQVCYFFHNL